MEEIKQCLALAYNGMSPEDIQADIEQSQYAQLVDDPTQLAAFIVQLCQEQ